MILDGEPPRMSPLAVPPGYEEEAIELARRALEDIPECRGAEYFVKWTEGALPILVIAFSNLAKADGNVPALGVCLMTVRRGTLSDVMPGNTLLTGDRLRDKILRSAVDYLQANGIQITLGLH